MVEVAPRRKSATSDSRHRAIKGETAIRVGEVALVHLQVAEFAADFPGMLALPLFEKTSLTM